MRKQTGFDVMVRPLGNGAGDSQHKDTILRDVQKYLDAGWEVYNTHVNQIAAGVIWWQIEFAKYDDMVTDVVTTGVTGGTLKVASGSK